MNPQPDRSRLYVATDGCDTWSGTRPEPNGDQSDGPFATLPRARDAIRELKRRQVGALGRPVDLFVRGGTYAMDEPMDFSRVGPPDPALKVHADDRAGIGVTRSDDRPSNV